MNELRTWREAETICGTLGYPSKMPGTSYGIPAAACKVGRKLAAIEGSTCSKCYAFERGNYRFASTKASQARRLAGLEDPRWAEAMVLLLRYAHRDGAGGKHQGQAVALYHRWHDSGDLQGRDHLAAICQVARATPWLRHWLPTREGKVVRDFVRDGGSIPENLTIRLSATMIDGAAPKAWPQTSTVASHGGAMTGHECPARHQDNKCGACRACWSADVANVTYPVH